MRDPSIHRETRFQEESSGVTGTGEIFSLGAKSVCHCGQVFKGESIGEARSKLAHHVEELIPPEVDPATCLHEQTSAIIDVVYLSDTGLRHASIKIRCVDCRRSFLFPQDLPIGISISGIARSFTGDELRVGLVEEYL